MLHHCRAVFDKSKVAEIDVNINECHQTGKFDTKSLESWKAMIRLHQLFVETQIPNIATPSTLERIQKGVEITTAASEKAADLGKPAS